MPHTHQKLMRRRMAWIMPALFVLACFAYLHGVHRVPPFTPTRWQARAALAEAGWCKPDAPIERRDGKLFIGHIECDLRNRTCQASPGPEFRVGLSYSWDISFTTPFGHWVASSSLPPVI